MLDIAHSTGSPMSRRPLPLLLALSACGLTPGANDSGMSAGVRDRCAEAAAQHRPPQDELDLSYLIDEVQRQAFGADLQGVEVVLSPLPGETDFFRTTVDLTTVEAAGMKRRYIIQADNRLFSGDPPPLEGLAAILAHELQHVLDYTRMASDDLVAFTLQYNDGDIGDYERKTDEAVLALGCGTGLRDWREWLYTQLEPTDETRARAEYYTPEEIDAWLESQRN